MDYCCGCFCTNLHTDCLCQHIRVMNCAGALDGEKLFTIEGIIGSQPQDGDDYVSCDDVSQRWVSQVLLSQKRRPMCCYHTHRCSLTHRRNRNAATRCHSVSLTDRIAFCKNDCSSMASTFTYLHTAEPDHSPARRMVPSALPWAAISVARPALKALRVNFCESSTRESDRNLRRVVVNVPVVKRTSGCPAERRARYGPNRCVGHKCGPNSLHKQGLDK